LINKAKKVPLIDESEFSDLLLKVKEISIANSHKSVVITADNTGANWLGVKNATLGMFPNNVLIVPQNNSISLLSHDHKSRLNKCFQENGIRLIIFSGQAEYSFNWIQNLKLLKFEIGVIFHGGLAELASNQSRQKRVQKVINYSNQGLISKIGIVKDGLDFWYKRQTEAQTFRLIPPLKTDVEEFDLNIEKDKIHIGIFGNSTFNKNRHHQIAAASLIENSVIHIVEPNEFNYMKSDKIEFRVHKHLNHSNFLYLIKSMHINLYCSYSESWGQIIMESFSMGVPCLFTDNSGISKFMGNEYVIKQPDDIEEMHTKIKQVLNKDENLDFVKAIEEFNQYCISLSDEFLRF